VHQNAHEGCGVYRWVSCYSSSRNVSFSFRGPVLHPRRCSSPSKWLFLTFQDVSILIPGHCSSPIETLFLFASGSRRMEGVAWSWMGEYSRSSGKASETRYCRKRLGRMAMRHGFGRLLLSTGSLLRFKVRLCLVSHYARCCLTYPKPPATQTPGQGLVVAITIWPERSRFSSLREYPSKPSAVDSTSRRTTLLEYASLLICRRC
jgi:hypothetical protein